MLFEEPLENAVSVSSLNKATRMSLLDSLRWLLGRLSPPKGQRSHRQLNLHEHRSGQEAAHGAVGGV